MFIRKRNRYYADNGYILCRKQRIQKSINILRRCLTNFNKLDFPRDKEIRLKIIYNLSKCLSSTCQYEEAIKYIDKGIQLAINLNTLYLLGELYYGKGSNLLKLNQSNDENVANNMKTALFIFELTKNENKLQIIKKSILKTKITIHNFLKTTYTAQRRSLYSF